MSLNSKCKNRFLSNELAQIYVTKDGVFIISYYNLNVTWISIADFHFRISELLIF